MVRKEKLLALRRKSWIALLSPVFPSRYEGSEIIDAEVKRILDAGLGILVEPSHPSTGDIIRTTLKLPEVFPQCLVKSASSPMALHQYDNPLNRAFIKVMAYNSTPMVTPHTRKVYARRGKTLPERNEIVKMTGEYMSKTTETLHGGGLTLLYPQVERQPQLGFAPEIDGPNAVLFKRYQRRYGGFKEFAVWPIGIEIVGIKDTKNASGLNLGRRYILHPDMPIMADRLVEIAGGVENVDRVVFDRLRKVVPENYR